MLKRLSLLLLTVALVALAAPTFASSPEASLPSFRVTSLHQWIVDRMVMWSPPGITYVKDARETPEEGRRRYEDIANDLISIAYDPAEKPIFGGPNGRAMTVALMTSIAFQESAFRKDVDYGVGPLSKGDAGKSWCLAQVMMGKAGPDGKTRTRVLLDGGALRFVNDSSKESGWGGEDLVQDRRKCLRVAIRLARMSFTSCSRLPVQDRLSMYASGSCEAGASASRVRVRSAQSWLWKSRPPLADDQAMELLHAPSPAGSSEHANVGGGIVLFVPS